MRTTLDIDDDVLAAGRDLARHSDETAGRVLSELARAALTGSRAADGVAEEKAFYGFQPLAADGRLVTEDAVERLREREGILCGRCSMATCRSRCWTLRISIIGGRARGLKPMCSRGGHPARSPKMAACESCPSLPIRVTLFRVRPRRCCATRRVRASRVLSG